MHEQFRPWGTVTPDFWGTAEPTRPDAAPVAAAVPQQAAEHSPTASAAKGMAPAQQHPAVAAAAQAVPSQVSDEAAETALPPGFHERIASVTSAFSRPEDRHALDLAGVEAEKLDQELTEKYGQHHAYTVNIRELRGWLAHLTGDSGTAARWYLHTTGLQIALHGAAHAETEGSVRRAVHTWQQVKEPAEVVQIGGDLAKVVTAALGEDSDAARFIRARVARYQQVPQ